MNLKVELEIWLAKIQPCRRLRLGSLLVGLLTMFTSPLLAELPVARLFTIFPPGGRIGTTVDVSVTGLELDGTNQLHFSHTGIAAKQKVIEATGQPDANKFVVAIASDAPPGIYEARVVGRSGVSNARAFVVGDLPETIESSTNHTAATALDTALETVINGRVEANVEDYFRFTAKKGQRVLIDCMAREIDSRMDDALVLYDANAKELERNRSGGLLDFTVPADGQYVLKVHDFLFRGGEEYFYRLSISTGPHIDFIFPPAGVAGTKSGYLLYGRNLTGGSPAKDLIVDGKRLEQLAVEIELPKDPREQALSSLIKPNSAVVDGIEYRFSSAEAGRPARISNPALLSFATAPVVVEKEPNDKPGQAQKISLPCEFVGQFFPQGDTDWFTFEVNKGDVYWVEVFSHRLGLPTDPFVLVQRVTKNDRGEEKVSDVQELSDSDANTGGVEFNTASRDPAWRFEVKEGGNYRIQVRDLFRHPHSSPDHVYRLSLRKEAPDFRLVATPQPPPPANKDAKIATVWTPLLRRGETMPFKVLAMRRDNFNGEIQLAVEGLPAGISYAEAKIEPNKNSTLLLLTASENAESWTGPVKIVGKGKAGEAEITREARTASVTWNVADYNNEAVQSRLSRDFLLAVSGSETIPISIEASEGMVWETSVAGKLQIPIKLTRRGDFNGNVKLKAGGIAALDSMKEIEVNGKTNAAAIELDLTQNKIPPGYHQFYLEAQTQGKYSKYDPDEVKTAEEAAKQAEKTAKELSTEATKAADELVTASKAVTEAEALAKSAAEKLAAAKTAAEKTPQEPDVIAAREAAETDANEAADTLKTAAETKVAAEKSNAEAAAKAKEAEKKKEEAVKLAKATAEKVKPKEVTVTTFSTAINLKITSAPITLAAETPTNTLSRGAKMEIPVKINRLYNFTDPVEFKLVVPTEVKGVTAAKLTIAKDQTEGRLVVETAKDATTGDHKLILQALLKLNNQELKVDQTIGLKVVGEGKLNIP